MAIKPGIPCVVVTSGGLAVSESPLTATGVTFTPSSNGFGIPVRIIAAGRNGGIPVTFVSEAGALLPGGA